MFNPDQASYQRLRSIIAERTSSIVLWIGSGVSHAADLPLWPELVKQLVKTAQEKISTLDPIDHAFREKQIDDVSKMRPWDAMSRIKEVLGDTSYQAALRRYLTPATNLGTTPEVYKLLWSLGPTGILNLNLDRLATRAFVEQSNAEPTEFVGRQIRNYLHVLRSPTRRFIANLHGILDDAESWVITKEDLAKLIGSQPYQAFIHSVFNTRTVVFVGMSADDTAAGGFLEDLNTKGVQGQDHFWVTDRRDDATDRWAEKIGIQLVRYHAPDNNHSELIELLHDIRSFLPQDKEPPPAVSGFSVINLDRPLPTPSELATAPPEDIRLILNSYAAALLKDANEEAYNNYEDFCRRFRRAIHNAWFYSLDAPDNVILGYKLQEEVGRGAFGRVFKAQKIDTGDIRAVKILWEEARDSVEMLGSFRRGVRSMQILSSRKISGMVTYHGTSEIPAIAVMDFIEGPDLKTAITSGLLNDWDTRLKIALDLARIIRSAHNLPERVLHRDVRPANVMLRDYYSDPTQLDLVVLDFDLSWHRDSSEKSVTLKPTTHGYLAPEQLYDISNTSTRSAAVDSFGFGMTLFFICSGRDPAAMEHNSKDWLNTVINAVRTPRYQKWRSLNRRIARLILFATKDRQAERWDMGQIEAELSRLNSTIIHPQGTKEPELWAEELAANLDLSSGYTWSQDKLAAVFELQSGLVIEIIADESGRKVHIKVDWTDRGFDRRKIGKYLPTAANKARSILKNAGVNVHKQISSRSAYLYADINVSDMRSSFPTIKLAMDQAAKCFTDLTRI